MDMQWASIGILLMALLAGLGMTITSLPGNAVILIVAVVYGYATHFSYVTVSFLFVLAGMFICGELVEFISGMMGAKKASASKQAIIGAAVGAVLGALIGTAFLPVIGPLLGALAGAYALSWVAEYLKTGDMVRAAKVARYTVAAQTLGLLFKIIVAISMVVAILVKVFAG